MPFKSKQQAKFMFAAAEGKIPGVAPSVGRDFVDASKGMSVKDLPQRVPKKPSKRMAKGLASGLISAKAATNMGY